MGTPVVKKNRLIPEAIVFAFKTYVNHVWLLLAAYVSYIAIQLLFVVGTLGVFVALNFEKASLLVTTILKSTPTDDIAPNLTILFSDFLIEVSFFILCILVLDTWLLLGIRRIALDLYEKNTSTIRQLFGQYKLILHAIVAWSLYTLAILFGIIAFIVPGLLAFATFGLYQTALVDKQIKALDALRYSAKITKGYRLQILGLLLLIQAMKEHTALLPNGNYYLFFLAIIIKPACILAEVYVYKKLVEYDKKSETN